MKKSLFYTNHNYKAIKLLAVKHFMIEPLTVYYLYTKFERILRGVGIFLVYLTWNYPIAFLMATFSKLEEFNLSAEDFSTYLKRVDLFFKSNDVQDQKKVPIFLNCIGSTTYSLLRGLVAPQKRRSHLC